MYDELLIPTDGSHGAERGVEHGIELATRYDAAVDVLYVVDESIYGETPALSPAELQLEQVEATGRELVDDVVHRATERGLDAEGFVTRGRPADEIVAVADREGVDLIVMGVHGTRPDADSHIGHVTDRVIRTAEMPVFPV
ncbi:universal stress protein [Haloplanus sp. C73]|uniref:universal stress protein n=1 Tax=Haloplanus sp. C73 TaxID=3421641 RepID=UPI003EBD5876